MRAAKACRYTASVISTIYLMGLRGSGKSTLGRRLAAMLDAAPGRGFVDLDDITPRVLGQATAADALRVLGEAAFRAGEAKALAAPEVIAAGVVALGGGTPTGKASLEILNQRRMSGARLIYLRAEGATLRRRLAATNLTQRPSLTGADPLVEIEVVFARRDPLYLEIADEVVQVDAMSEDQALDALATLARAM